MACLACNNWYDRDPNRTCSFPGCNDHLAHPACYPNGNNKCASHYERLTQNDVGENPEVIMPERHHAEPDAPTQNGVLHVLDMNQDMNATQDRDADLAGAMVLPQVQPQGIHHHVYIF